MKKIGFLCCLILTTAIFSSSFREKQDNSPYTGLYQGKLTGLELDQLDLLEIINRSDLKSVSGRDSIKMAISRTRNRLKTIDFWLRYLDPIIYKKINGPLPVEWETEVFEKFEKPYRRVGAGLTLAALYLEENDIVKDSLLDLIRISAAATASFEADSNRRQLGEYQNFYLCNRLFLLNLASIYTTGFECPDTARIIPELKILLASVGHIYDSYNESFPSTVQSTEYLNLYKKLIAFTSRQPDQYSVFDHYTFIRDFVNPLYAVNQELIRRHQVRSSSFVDYSLNNKNSSIFSKNLYRGQNAKGIFLRVDDPEVLSEIDRIGKQLFYDPILSGNNKRSCASCHKPSQYFTDTLGATSLQFDRKHFLSRNSPTLINADLNHLLMNDGSMISLQDQARAVMTNHMELACSEKEILKKVLECPDYNKVFSRLLEFTPQEDSVTLEHISSAISFYYSKYSSFSSAFDDAMNGAPPMNEEVQQGFNLFMSKAQCATCHFVPQFNGVKPPYVGSEFEVLGVPSDLSFKQISADSGRYLVNPSVETLHAFRTGSIRNAAYTAPYMHNGVFRTLDEVIDFYDAGGGAGKGLQISNQTLSADSLHLSKKEKELLKKFMLSLSEKIQFEPAPRSLPRSQTAALNRRKIGGEY